MGEHYPGLFQPLKLGTMTVKNRLLMSAMSINFGVDDKGRVNRQLTAYFVARARGGAGAMLVGGGAVHPTGLELPHLPTLWDDGCIGPLEKMVRAVKPFGCSFGVQLMHGGRQSYHDRKVAPSAIAAPAVVKGVPRELSPDEIMEMVAAFGDAARRCRQAGFDFIEIHAAHGYLINQFLSPNANHRRDRYGGCFENRIRFLIQIIEDIRSKCGRDFPVGIRINGEDYISNGWSMHEALRLSRILERLKVAYLHVSAGVYGSTQLTIPSMYVEQGCFVHLAARVKQEVALPVIAVGRIKTPEMAEEIIKEGKADMVAMGRSFLADPRWPLKARSGRRKAIRHCVGCCLGCIHAVLALEPGGCVVNPEVGREYLSDSENKNSVRQTGRSAAGRRVLVVGAGPSGLAAARAAAKAGHMVTVLEKEATAGGALALAAKAPGRGELNDILDFFLNEIDELGVEIRFGCRLDSQVLDRLRPQVVVLATGALPEVPMIKGLAGSQMELFTVNEVMAGKADVPGEKTVVLGGGQAGLMGADYLATRGKSVAVLHRGDHFAEEMSSNDRYYLRERLKQGDVSLFKKVRALTFASRGVSFRCDGKMFELEDCDSAVIAGNMKSVRQAANLLKGRKVELQIVGDAKSPRHLMYAIEEGERVVDELSSST